MSTSSTVATTLASNSQNNTTLANDDDPDTWISKTPRLVFLGVFITIGFLGNLFLLLTISQSRRFRSLAFFIFLGNLAVVNIAECVLNMSLLMASSVINQWKFGEIACKASSFFLYFICKETFLALTITTADRFVAVRFRDKYDTVVSRPRIAILITFTWVQSFSFSVPIATGTVPSSVNKYIVYCTLSKGTSIIYAVFSVLFCFIVPFVLIVIFFVKIIRTGCRTRYLNRNLSSQIDNFSEVSSETNSLKQDSQHTNVTGTLCIVWLILEGPHVITSYYAQFSGSELIQVSTEDAKYVWYVELVLLWLRFSYAMALPIIAFTWNKELWKCFKDLILCRKNNSVVDESFKKPESDTLRLEKKIKDEKLKEKESMMSPKEQRVFQVPVLFATSHGVHIKTTQNESSENETDDASNKTGTLTGRKCDVVGSRDNLNNVEDDTSDYDSGNELDPFSVSHPVCVRQLKDDCELRNGKRSLSEPEVRINKGKCTENGNLTNSVACNGDSGVDLSSPQSANTLKHVFHLPSRDLMLQNSQTFCTEILEENCFYVSANAKPLNVDTVIKEENHTNRRGNDMSLDQHPDIMSVSKHKGISQESPVPKRKKKRRKEKQFDTQSINSLTSCNGIPPRPPPRLAPILSPGNQVQLGTGRPGSRCSSQASCMEDGLSNGAVTSHNSSCDIAKSDDTSVDNLSITSFNLLRNLRPNKLRQSSSFTDSVSKCVLNYDDTLQLDCKHEIESVPEEVLTPSDCNIQASFASKNTRDVIRDNTSAGKSDTETIIQGIVNQAIEQYSDVDSTSETQTKETPMPKNAEARRKRREKKEKFITSGILNDGYTRLVPETP